MLDIFGLHNNTLQGADLFSQDTGYRIVLPDFFRGKPWDVNNMPPREGRPALNAWIQDAGSWEKVGPVLKAAVELVNREDPVAVGVCLLWRFV